MEIGWDEALPREPIDLSPEGIWAFHFVVEDLSVQISLSKKSSWLFVGREKIKSKGDTNVENIYDGTLIFSTVKFV